MAGLLTSAVPGTMRPHLGEWYAVLARFAAFISYAHADVRWAKWLHRKLEGYAVPRGLRQDRRRPLRPIFRDRDELAAGPSLSAAIDEALLDSDSLIVVASPRAAASEWVNREVEVYAERFGLGRVFTLLVDGDPSDAAACFPAALRSPGREPLAADPRKGADGRRGAVLKIASGMLGVGYDRLAERDAARRNRRLTGAVGASGTAVAAMGALTVYANHQRQEAVRQEAIALANLETSEAVTDFLIQTFEIANPATENASTITARTIIERSFLSVETELEGQPDVQARLFTALGQIGTNLALYERAEESLERAYELMPPDSVRAAENRFALAAVRYRQGRVDDALGLLVALPVAADEYPAFRARMLILRGNVRADQHEQEAAESDYAEAARLLAEGEQDDQLVLAALIGNWAVLVMRSGRTEEGFAKFDEAERIHADLKRPDDRALARLLSNRAFFELATKRLTDAKRSIRRAITLYEAVLDPPHPDLANARLVLGQALEELSDYVEAEAAYRTALVELSAIYPDGHVEIGYAHAYIASSLIRQGDGEAALHALDQAADAYALAGLLPDDVDVNDLDIYRGLARAEMGEPEWAAALCAAGLASVASVYGVRDPYVRMQTTRCIAAVPDADLTTL